MNIRLLISRKKHRHILALLLIILGGSLFILLSCGSSIESDPRRAYSANSPWNTLIGPNPEYEPSSNIYVEQLYGDFGINPTSYTMPVYIVTRDTPKKTIRIRGVYSEVSRKNRIVQVLKPGSLTIPWPAGTTPARGTDAHVIIWNQQTGDEWGFWKVDISNPDQPVAQNGYYYKTKWSGVPPKGFISRGAGIPYLAGLIRRWEIEEEGYISHAIAMAIRDPGRLFVYPATRSDGDHLPPAIPMGARFQLDPALTDADFDRWGLSPVGKIIAVALQEYGCIVVDSSGHTKLLAEYEGTAHWNGMIHDGTVGVIPYSAFKVLRFPR